MTTSPKRLSPRPRYLLIACLLAVAAFGMYTQTASNTVPASRLGSGSSAISGYTISSIGYTQNAANPQNVDALTFTIAPVATTTTVVKAQLVTGGSWYNCTTTNGSGAVSCATTAPQATVVAPDQLTITAAG
jgi:hypothetical protein